jgi:hypothetical protein
MKSIYATLACIVYIPFLIGFPSEEENKTDCYGTIVQQNGEKIDIEHIEIGTRTNWDVYSIPWELYATSYKPTPDTKDSTSALKSKIDESTDKAEIFIKSDPRDSIITFKPTQIKTIKLPNPNTTWIYQEKNKDTQHKYLEVLINGERCLATKETKVKAIQKDNSTSRTIKLRALREFTINECTIIPTPENKQEKRRTS